MARPILYPFSAKEYWSVCWQDLKDAKHLYLIAFLQCQKCVLARPQKMPNVSLLLHFLQCQRCVLARHTHIERFDHSKKKITMVM